MMRPTDRLVVASGVSVMLGALTLMPITQDRSFLGWSLLLVMLLGLGACLMRRTWVGHGGALAVQVAILVAFLGILARLQPMPVAELGMLDRLSELMWSAIGHMRDQAAPMSPQPGVFWLMVAGVGGAMVMTDLLVNTLRRQVWGLAPTLTLFLIPALSLQGDLNILGGLAVGAGYCGILLAEGINRADRWRRGVLDDPDHPTRSVAPVLWSSAAVIAVPALVLTMIAWLAIPTGSLAWFDGGRGSGNGGPLELGDPTLDLRRNLNRPDDVTVMTYTSSDGRPTYLRMASLPVFNENGWQNAPIQVLQGQPGRVPGVSSLPDERTTFDIRIGDFGSEYLPLPWAPRQLEIPGEWGYDPESLVYIATGDGARNTATQGLNYQVESARLDPSGEALSNARAGTPDDYEDTTAQPEDLPEEIIELANEITEDAPSDALKAAAIQAYLRSGRFTYSTEPAPGSGYQALTNFLFEDQRGYCEQFAAAMAIMARVVGIPSRVAIGFLPGERVGEGRYEVTAHDLHSWPELYFDGLGWVRWEPTPGNGAAAPAWTVASEGGIEPSAEPSETETVDVSEPTFEPTIELSGPGATASVDVPTDTGEDTWGVAEIVLVIGAAVVLVGLMLLPGIARQRRRLVRLSNHGRARTRIEGAWDELRDTVIDHRGTWPAGSPRAIGTQLARRFEPEDAEAVGQLALLVERARYARTVEQPAAHQLKDLVHQLHRAITAPAGRGQRLWARLWPKSLWRKDTRGAARGAGRREL